MKKMIFEDENYKLILNYFCNPITKEDVKEYKVIPKKNTIYMLFSVLNGKFFARFPEGLSFTGKYRDLWLQAIIDADSFIKAAESIVEEYNNINLNLGKNYSDSMENEYDIVNY